jgi:single-stranded DNA-binding protein
MDLNDVQLHGNVTKFDAKELDSGSVVVNLTVALDTTRFDAKKSERVIATTFVSVEYWPVKLLAAEDLLYPGDRVRLAGELSQQTGAGDKVHTRVVAHYLTVTKRGRQGKEALGMAVPAPRSAPAAPQGEDPWATQPAGAEGGAWA